MRIHVRRPNSHRESSLDLGAKLDLHLLGIDVLIVLPIVVEVAVFVQQTPNFVSRRNRSSAVIDPFAGHREMKSKTRLGM